jgi:hypothetical protein
MEVIARHFCRPSPAFWGESKDTLADSIHQGARVRLDTKAPERAGPNTWHLHGTP